MGNDSKLLNEKDLSVDDLQDKLVITKVLFSLEKC